jgi:competence protein ComEC
MEQGSATQGRKRPAIGRWRSSTASLGQRLHWSVGDIWAALHDDFERELAERIGFQWLAVGFSFGALCYFLLPREPVGLLLYCAAAGVSAVAVLTYRRGTSWRLAAVAAICLAGASAAKIRVDSLAGPHLERGFTATISGRVLDVDNRAERRPRIVLDTIRSEGISPAAMPRRLRITIGGKSGLPPLGARIALLARLGPVAEPVVPGGYDPRRAAFFEGIGGSGFALGGWTVEEPPPKGSLRFVVARVRAAVVARIMAAQPGEAGAVAAALLVGERSGLSENTNESLRISGLAHILSISGLHMMLIAGTAFVVTRGLLALSPRLALTRPIRKWAALIALLVVTLYLALSGGGAATLRAYIMAAIMFAAILVDRPAISMRNLAIAVFVVLALEPEGVVEPGFQMSFAAVAALVAGWEAWHQRQRVRLVDEPVLPGLPILRYLGRGLLGVALTSLVAGLATAPFAAYHFERVATYSLLGNVLTAPLVSAIIMPFGLLSLVAMPFGLEQLPLIVMAAGTDALLWISDWVAGLPGADARAPPITVLSLSLMTAGMVWICLWRTRWRLFGVAAIVAGLALIPVRSAGPDLLIAPEGDVVAVRDLTGVLRVSGSRAGSYTVEQMLENEPNPVPDVEALRTGVACDPAGCILRSGESIVVAHVHRPEAFAEDCLRAEIIVAALQTPDECRRALLVDRARLARYGAHAIRLNGPGEFVITTERTSFPRPWQAGGRS